MELLNFFATIGMTINDLLAIFSVISSLIQLFGLFSSDGDLGNYSVLGLFFGGLFQISMAITGTVPARIGVLVPMTPLLVNWLFGLSFFMVSGHWWLRRIRTRLR